MPLTTLAANLLDLRLEFLNPILAEDLDTRPKRLLEECWRMTFGHPNDLDLGLRARPIARGLDPLLYPLQILLYLFSLHHSLGFYRRFTDRKSTRLNSSHVAISYAVFCLNKHKIVLTSL